MIKFFGQEHLFIQKEEGIVVWNGCTYLSTEKPMYGPIYVMTCPHTQGQQRAQRFHLWLIILNQMTSISYHISITDLPFPASEDFLVTTSLQRLTPLPLARLVGRNFGLLSLWGCDIWNWKRRLTFEWRQRRQIDYRWEHGQNFW